MFNMFLQGCSSTSKVPLNKKSSKLKFLNLWDFKLLNNKKWLNLMSEKYLVYPLRFLTYPRLGTADLDLLIDLFVFLAIFNYLSLLLVFYGLSFFIMFLLFAYRQDRKIYGIIFARALILFIFILIHFC